MIPRHFIRIWLGQKNIPAAFEDWWGWFQTIHSGWKFTTIDDDQAHDLSMYSEETHRIYKDCDSYAGRSDVIRIIALHILGGIYVDTDVMPLRSFDPLLSDPRPFAAKRSRVSFESAVLGSPAGHAATEALIRTLPEWYWSHEKNSASVRTGPAFVSSVWFPREDVRQLPTRTFYPYNGFGAPKRDEKIEMFSNTDSFPPDMYAAHFSNHRWGGTPK